jgi:hypothetical protein
MRQGREQTEELGSFTLLPVAVGAVFLVVLVLGAILG